MSGRLTCSSCSTVRGAGEVRRRGREEQCPRGEPEEVHGEVAWGGSASAWDCWAGRGKGRRTGEGDDALFVVADEAGAWGAEDVVHESVVERELLYCVAVSVRRKVCYGSYLPRAMVVPMTQMG